MLQRARGLLISAPPWRALVEALLVQVPALAVALALILGFDRLVLVRAVESIGIVAGPLCLIWCAGRMEIVRGSWRGTLGKEARIGAVLGLVPALLIVGIEHAVATSAGGRIALAARSFEHRIPPVLFTISLVVFFCLAFLACRLGVRAVLFWNRLRRTHLIWSLTHAHLMVVALGAVLLSVPLVGGYIYYNHTFLLGLLPILFTLASFTVLGMLIVLPPSALFSYIFARRTTRRVEALTAATSELSAGNYHARIPVQGADEVALLQANFNAMAAELEAAVSALQAERDTVAKLLEARRELIASVSHELRTPVATLRSYLESTRLHWDGAPPTSLKHDLEVMEHETIHLQALIADLFTLARAEVARLDLRVEPTDIGPIVERVAQAAAPLAWQSTRVEVVGEATGPLPLVAVDAGRFEQVLHNLLQNGIRHTQPGGIVAVSATAAEDAVVVCVRDTGEGIVPEELPRIWERFYRTKRSRDRSLSGTGLGLALVKELTEAMGGTATVESALGEGSCFAVRFSALATPPAPTDKRAPSDGSAGAAEHQSAAQR